MRWNTLELRLDSIWKGLPDTLYVYFVHFYACRPEREEAIIAQTEYGTVLFHRERGQFVGNAVSSGKESKGGTADPGEFLCFIRLRGRPRFTRGAPSLTT
jgi:imidazoleglycerol phosphate synthase glutamine amidotransferase subunit HisH